MNFEAVIGLEVHIQLLTASKIFCSCATDFGAEPNSQVCPVCMALPGALPVLNEKAIDCAILLALATESCIKESSVFARKNYFYPDLPKGYQISQFDQPFCEGGSLIFEKGENKQKTVTIRRIHLEEDAGKSIHAEAFVAADETLIDLNRCGVPLLELVTEPDLRTPEEAALFLMHLRQLIRYLGICDGNMEEGSLRCDANVSLRPLGSDIHGTKTELKNMNSFRHVERALHYEIVRQSAILNDGGEVKQETLLWDVVRSVAEPMRSKEHSHDYRYFPEPDLPPVLVSRDRVEKMRTRMPELPQKKKMRYVKEWGLSEYDASVLTEDPLVAEYFEAVCRNAPDIKMAGNWVMGEVMRAVNDTNTAIINLKMTPEYLASLLQLVQEGTINSTMAKKIFTETLQSGKNPLESVQHQGLAQITDEIELSEIIQKVMDQHTGELASYLEGKEKLFGFFIGEVMKMTSGRANAKRVNELLRKKLSALKQ